MDEQENDVADSSQPDNNNDRGSPDPDQSADKPDTVLDERTAHFIGLLSDDDEVSRWKAAEALGRIRDPGAVEELIGTLWDDDARVRLKPLQRLYRMENEWAQEIIREALEKIRREMSRQ